MQQSNDIIILDGDQEESPNLKINETTLNFDDIIVDSNDRVKTSKKKQSKTMNQSKMNKINLKLANQEQKLMSKMEVELTEPERQNLIHIIQKYQSNARFGSYVRNELKITFTDEALSKKSLSQLEGILNKIRLHLDNQNLNKMYDGILFGSTLMIETISKPVANVDGFQKMLMENEEFLNCWERYKCESIMPTVPSHIQMVFILAQTYLIAYASNKMKEPSDEVKQIIKDVEKEIEQDKQAQQDNETVEQNKNPKSETKEEKTILENGMLI
jgi:hypothetical protein